MLHLGIDNAIDSSQHSDVNEIASLIGSIKIF